ncbi:hypothetical protein ACN47E_006714 [Coniothyrium glycines]
MMKFFRFLKEGTILPADRTSTATTTNHKPQYGQEAQNSDIPSPTATGSTATRTVSTRIQESIPAATPTSRPAASSQPDTRSMRPGLQHRSSTARTRYIDMFLNLDAVPLFRRIVAPLSIRTLLADTSSSLRRSPSCKATRRREKQTPISKPQCCGQCDPK